MLESSEKILVTGHKGFVGKSLCEALLACGHSVYGYDIEDGDDIRDEFKLNSVISRLGVTTVIHLAARAGVGNGMIFPQEYFSTNIIGTHNVVESCKRNKVRRLVFFSSSSVLGGNKDVEVGLAEDSPLKPISIYGITKMTGEALVKNSGIQYSIVRPFSIYGESGRKDMVVYKWIEKIKAGQTVQIYGNGDSLRGYTYIKDLVGAVVSLVYYMKNNPLKRTVFHIGGSEVISIFDLHQLFTKFCEKNKINHMFENLPLPDWDIKMSFADSTMAQMELGFAPKKNFNKIIQNILTKELKV